MCGVNFIWDKQGKLDDRPIQNMQKGLSHRGPDAAKFTSHQIRNQQVFLGSSRLKIIDQDDNSNQPFVSTDGRYHLIFNGEIYNHAELKNDLIERGYSFRTHSDTETLLYFLIQYGETNIHLLNGMFTFVFFDSVEWEVLVARDRFGIKPLYKYQDESQIIFSSEIRGIMATDLFDKRLEEGELHNYLTFGHTSRFGSMVQGIEEIEPGTVLRITQKSVSSGSFVMPAHDPNSSLEDVLMDSIVRQIPSVPFGLFLSGGVDSTLILALLKANGNDDFPTFTLGNKTHGTSDYSFASKAAVQYGSDHRSFEISESDLDLFPEFLDSIDDPVGDSGAFMTWLLSKKAKEEGIKVILSGSGADELFAGYNRHLAFSKYLKNKTAFLQLKRLGRPILNAWPKYSIFPFSGKASQASKFFNAVDSDEGKTYLSFVAAGGFFKPSYTDFKNRVTDIRQALLFDRQNYLVKDVLAVGDRMSMSHGLEMRVPFLDNAVANYADKIPDDGLTQYGGKSPLKEILISLGGRKYCQRKEGFGLPTKRWLGHRGQFNELVQEAISLDSPKLLSQLSKDQLRRMVKQHQSGKADYSLQLWSYLVIAKWLQKHFS